MGQLSINFHRDVAALCIASNSVYKGMVNVHAYDKRRSATMFPGGMPVVAHPPCRTWSAFTSHQAKPEPGEAELGFICAEFLRREGGVLEQPAHSRLFKAAGLPLPDEGVIDGMFSLEVEQAWWGYSLRKATWLCFSKVDRNSVVLPSFLPHNSRSGEGDKIRWTRMSKNQRAATTPEFAKWLVGVARSVR